MSLTIERFDEFFRALYRDKQGQPLGPFPWQTRLAKQVFEEGWPDSIDLPTASGKTACIDIAVFVLACQADRETSRRTVGRRIFFTVNRRVIVDEAFDRSLKLARQLLEARDGILKEVAQALHAVSGDSHAPPLDVAQLRGGIYRDRAWARSITQPIVVCTTADQLGSRLLFRGYGVSASSAPIHAALCGCDSLVLLDEAHVTRAFCETMGLLTRYQAQHTTAPRMHFVQMTATPTGGVKKRFGLDGADRVHPILKARQEASKPVTLVKLEKKKPIGDEIVCRAIGALSDTRKAIGIIVNRVQTARDIERLIRAAVDNRRKKDQVFEAEIHLVIGRMRPIDRDDLQEKLRTLVGPERPDKLDKHVFVVATQCLEVGADYDFDALITECASLDALRQRLGRLNRKGRPIDVVAAIVTNDDSLKGEDPIYGEAMRHTWDWLWSNKDKENQLDFGISRFEPLWKEVEEERATYLDEECPKPLLSPAPHAAVLLPAHLDALCQTSPRPEPSPDVGYFIHGPQRDNAEVNVCWRADLGSNDALWPDIVRLLPPTSPECMTVPLWELQRWMRGNDARLDRDADMPVAIEIEEKEPSGRTGRRVVVWRGSKECRVIDTPDNLRPGDTVIMRTGDGAWQQLGHIPGAPTESELKRGEEESDEEHAERRVAALAPLDIAERATREVRRRLIVRLHDAFAGRADLRGLPADQLRTALKPILERLFAPEDEHEQMELARVLSAMQSPIERHLYEAMDNAPDASPNEAILFRRLLEPANRLIQPPDDEDDGEDGLSERDQPISLNDHAVHVKDRLALALGKLGLGELESSVRASAPLHDIGKADFRFQALLAGFTPYEAMGLGRLLAKSGQRGLTRDERRHRRERAQLPPEFRHEMLSVELVANQCVATEPFTDRDLLLHLIAAHHGHARPFAPVVLDDANDETRSVEINGTNVSAEQRKRWIPSHRLDSGVAERFWKLTREHGWWGLAWLEAILRLADQQASAAEQEGVDHV
jgi:CRISPR-associated endonuclease/helicase Cas3